MEKLVTGTQMFCGTNRGIFMRFMFLLVRLTWIFLGLRMLVTNSIFETMSIPKKLI